VSEDDGGAEAKAEVSTEVSTEIDLDLLRTRVESDPGCAEFSTLAEIERRAGRLDAARAIAERGLSAAPGRFAGRVVLGLIFLDQGDVAAAREELSAIFALPVNQGQGAEPARVADPEPSSPAPDLARGPGHSARAPARDLPVGEGSAFRTRTMARLLERQGDRGRAEEILEGLEAHPAESAGGAKRAADAVPDRRIRETLERWLENIQGDHR